MGYTATGDADTSRTTVLTGLEVGVGGSESVTTLATSLLGFLCRRAFASKGIDLVGYRLEVSRITAGSVSTEVVDCKADTNLRDLEVVGETVRIDSLVRTQAEHTVTTTNRSTPMPAVVVAPHVYLGPEARWNARGNVTDWPSFHVSNITRMAQPCPSNS